MDIKSVHKKLSNLISSESFTEALEYIEGEIIPHLKSANQDSESSKIIYPLYCDIAYVYYDTAEYNKSKQYLEMISNTEYGNESIKCIKLNVLHKRVKYREAIEYLNKQLQKDWSLQEYHELLTYLGSLYFWHGDTLEAEQCFRDCYKYSIDHDDLMILSGCLYMFGYIAFQRGHLLIAENYFNKALEYHIKLGKKYKIGVTYQMLGILYYRMGLYSQAKKNINLSLRYFVKCSYVVQIIHTIIAYARIYMFQNDYDKACNIFKKAYIKSSEIGYTRGIALTADYLGEIYYRAKNYNKALDILYKAESLVNSTAPKGDIAVSVNRHISDVLLALGQHEKAEDYMNIAYDIAILLGDNYELGAIFRNYGILAGKRNNNSLAKLYFEQSFTILRQMTESYEYTLTQKAITEYYEKVYGSPNLSDEIRDGILKELRNYSDQISSIDKYAEYKHCHSESDDRYLHHDLLVGKSRNILQIVNKIKIYAPSSIPVLIIGETGTGKELIARLIHKLSLRAKGPFVAVNCASIPETVFESEVFGHRKGSFTGAFHDKQGLLEAANGGTLFLDEISELSNQQQAKLLRALQEGKIRRVGETAERPIDVRVVSASNEDVKFLVASGRLRKDFYYRICVETLELEPLRKRKEDILPLFIHYLDGNRSELKVEDGIFDLLDRYHWPGNVRELVGIVKILKLVSEESGIIRVCDLPIKIRDATYSEHARTGDLLHRRKGSLSTEGLAGIDDANLRDLIISSLSKHKGNKSAVSRELGLSRSTLYRRMEELNIEE